MVKKAVLLLLLAAGAHTLHADVYFDFSQRARSAYGLILDLRFREAFQGLDALEQQEPDNLIAHYLENYIETLAILIDDDENAYRRFHANMDKRLWQCARGDARSPYYRYVQAEIRLQWAALRLRFGDYLDGASDIKQAYALLEENERRHPDFVANRKSLGILHALVGAVPEEYRWAVRLLGGMKGSVEQGLTELESALEYAKSSDFPFADETLLAYCAIQLHLNNQEAKAWQILKNSRLNPRISPLAAFALAHVALRAGRCDEAIRLLQESPQGEAFHPLAYNDYLLGVAKLSRLDDDAGQVLERFISRFKGKNSLKSAFQRLAWHHLVKGDEGGYWACMQAVKQQGSAQSDPDQAALREANTGEMPDVTLLRARLLFDGGYFARALETLAGKEAMYAGSVQKRLEYVYRMGRICHKMNKADETVRYYEQAISMGARMPWYFACNAALQLGMLYESRGDKVRAAEYFRKCLDIHPEEYAGSLHAKAKAGLNRLR